MHPVLFSLGLSVVSASSCFHRVAVSFYYQACNKLGTGCFFLSCTDRNLTVWQSPSYLFSFGRQESTSCKGRGAKPREANAPC